MSRFLKAELIVLLCVLVLKAIDLQTNCVLAGTAGILQQAAKIAPNSQFVHTALGYTYYGLKQVVDGDRAFYQAHVISCKKAVQKNPNDAAAHFNLGEEYYYADKLEQAIKHYEEAVRLGPYHVWKWEQLGDAYSKNDQYNKAMTAYKEAITLITTEFDKYASHEMSLVNCYLGLEFAYRKLERTEEALACRKRALQLWPDAADYFFRFGTICNENGDLETAIKSYTNSLAIKPASPEAHSKLGQVYLEMGNKQKAMQEYEALKELDQELAGELYFLLQESEVI